MRERSERALRIMYFHFSGKYDYCKRGNIGGTLIFADFAVFQQARIQKAVKIFAIFCMHILDTYILTMCVDANG